MFKYQEEFAVRMAEQWINGSHEYVRSTIRSLKNKAQAAYIAAETVSALVGADRVDAAVAFVAFIHPNN